MPLALVLIVVVRAVKTYLGGGDYAEAEAQVPGSPFLARVYRAAQSSVGRDEAAEGTATLDEMQRLSVMNPACPLAVGDIAFLPRADGTFTRAKVVRLRFYSDRVQCDLETGAEGTALPENLPMLTSAEQQALQAQIDALTQQNQSFAQQLGDLTMSFKNGPVYSGKFPTQSLTATGAITKPAQSTTFQVNSSSPVIVTLYPSTGDNTEVEFINLGAGLVTFAYPTSPAQTGATLANIALSQHDGVAFKEAGTNDWEGAGG